MCLFTNKTPINLIYPRANNVNFNYKLAKQVLQSIALSFCTAMSLVWIFAWILQMLTEILDGFPQTLQENACILLNNK